MKRNLQILLLSVLTILSIIQTPVTIKAKSRGLLENTITSGDLLEGFVDIDGHTYYYRDQLPLTSSWIHEEGKTYRTNENGMILMNQMFKIDGNKYCAKKDGSLYVAVFFKFKNKKYYANNKGIIQCDRWLTVAKKKYKASQSGMIYASRWVSYRSKRVYVNASGVLQVSKTFKVGKVKYQSNKYGAIVKVVINAPLIGQRPKLPTGCELVSTTMLIGYYKNKSYKSMAFYKQVKKYTSINKGYNGDPKKHGNIYCFPKAMKPLIKKYTGSVTDVKSFSAMKKQLRLGKPVITWMRHLSGFGLHCILVTGYDQKYVYYNDPYHKDYGSSSYKKKYKNKKISIKSFKKKFKAMGYRAITY